VERLVGDNRPFHAPVWTARLRVGYGSVRWDASRWNGSNKRSTSAGRMGIAAVADGDDSFLVAATGDHLGVAGLYPAIRAARLPPTEALATP
jgi:hypothetical protein